MDRDTGARHPHDDLDGLFPAGVACAWSQAAAADARLFPEEAAAAACFAPARVEEFRHGRACARRALVALGAAPVAIPVGAHREPLWPEGIVGSISHAGSVAAAAVARRSAFSAIGLDVETTTVLEPALIGSVCRPAEAQRLAAAGAAAGAAAMLVFSAKEAVYKALWPDVRRFIDFQEVEIVLDASRDEFRVRAHGANCPAELADALRGRIIRRASFLAAGAWLEARGRRAASAGA